MKPYQSPSSRSCRDPHIIPRSSANNTLQTTRACLPHFYRYKYTVLPPRYRHHCCIGLNFHYPVFFFVLSHWSSEGTRAVIRQSPNSSCTFQTALRSWISTSHGIWNGCSPVPSIAALTKRVCFLNSRGSTSPGRWVVVQHRSCRHASTFIDFCLQISVVSNLDCLNPDSFSTMTDLSLSMSVKCDGVSVSLLRQVTSFALQPSWICPKQCSRGRVRAIAPKRSGYPARCFDSV